MKKYLIPAFLLILISIQSIASASNPEIKNSTKAMILKDLGLFTGTDLGFELERKPTRAEGAVMLVRLLGREAQAKQQNSIHPFSDVPAWASPYIGYMYQNGLTKGQSEIHFGSTDAMNAYQYTAFALRALGYDDSIGDFKWDVSLDKAKEIGILTLDAVNDLKDKQEFLRDDVVGISFNALKAKIKDGDATLGEKLEEQGVISKSKAIVAGIIEAYKTDSDLQQINSNMSAYVVKKDGNTYFINDSEEDIAESGKEVSADNYYKMNYDATIITKLGTSDFVNLVVQGDYIYCLKNNNIVRMKPDGSGQKILSTDIAKKMQVKGDWIYYVNNSDSAISPSKDNPLVFGKLYRIRIDGTGKEKLTDRGTQTFWVGDERIYFNSDGGLGNVLFSIASDGSNEAVVIKGNSYCIQEYDGKVYFTSDKDGGSPKIFTFDPDENSIEEVYGTSKEHIKDFGIINNRIYFIDYSENFDEGPLYSVRIDGKRKTEIEEADAYWPNFSGEWIYYYRGESGLDTAGNTTRNSILYRIRFDGSSREFFDKTSWKKAE